jgi:hypothetical protein
MSHLGRSRPAVRGNRLVRLLPDRRCLNNDPARARPERNAEGARGHREETRDQRATRDGNRKQERRDHSLHPPHSFPFPPRFGIGCLSFCHSSV